MRNRWLATAALVAYGVLSAAAQDKPAPQPQEKPAAAAPSQLRDPSASTSRVAVPLKVTVLLSRYKGEKRVSSLPYMLGVTANGFKTTLRMGVDVPVVQTVFANVVDGKSIPQSSYSYRNVGTNIDCTAFSSSATPGLFELNITASDSSIGLDTADNTEKTGIVQNVPTFRNFNTSFSILLRDGQTTQYTSATDPVTGEVTKVDVTLNVIK
jgi:hypothetical protein